MVKNKTFYVTTPIYYVNAKPHAGSAYTTILADILARWNRLLGKDVFFLTGTDEHGQKIQEAAEKAGLKPQKFVDEITNEFKKTFKLLNISNDYFIRTTDKKHEQEVQKILQELYDKKYIYKGNYEAYYCIGCEQYLTKSDLIDGKCPLHKTEPELREEEAYLFKLSSFQDKLLKVIKSGEYNIQPDKRRNEVINFIEQGLQDISISRLKEKVSWGIELPFDKKHTCFVWVDAFWNYVTGLKNTDSFEKFWPADLQLMAKDILRVHATIWPALLLATKNKLPKTLFVHGFFTVNGQKMSKSLGNVIDPIEISNKYGADTLRYYLVRNIPLGDDGDISLQSLTDRHNNELANKFGNLVSRVSALAEQNGLVKTKNKLIEKLDLDRIKNHFDKYEVDKALNEIFTFIDVCNEYVQETKPWETKNKKVLYELADSIKALAILLWPFMPETCEKIATHFDFEIKLKNLKTPLKNLKLTKSPILFQKIEMDKQESKQSDKKPNQNINKSEKIEGIMGIGEIKFDDWSKLDLRVAQIKKVEDIEGADKLYKITLNVGELGERVVCAGLKQFYKKEDLKNKKVIVFTNLAPRVLKGIESKGMILAASNSDHTKVILLAPEKDIEPGSKIS